MLKRTVLLLFALCVLAACRAVPAALASTAETYSIEVDLTNQITTVYRRADNAIVRQMICSSGRGGSTPRGTFRLEKTRESTDRKPWYYISGYRCYVKFATRIRGSILFHSIPYTAQDMESIDTEALALLGTPASHGCIRLRWQDAEWIAMNCPDGTVTNIYTGAAPKEKLRKLLLLEGYSEDCGLTYRQFLDSWFDGDDSGSLGRGSKGKRVTALQERLIGLGFFSGEESTGQYDTATVVAVMRYQLAAKLPATGITTRELYRRIRRENTLCAEYATLREGARGTLVARLQSAMRDIGFYDGAVDGVYGEALSRAVRTYCACMGIDATDRLTPDFRASVYALLRRLNRRYGRGQFAMVLVTHQRTVACTARQAALYDVPSLYGKTVATVPAGEKVRLVEAVGDWRRVEYKGAEGYTLARNLTVTTREVLKAHWGHGVEETCVSPMNRSSVGGGVMALKNRLKQLGFFTGDSTPVYDSETADAVRAYQATAQKAATGWASVRLQRAIFDSDEVTGIRVTLTEGSEGPAVTALQRALAALGYYEEPCDGAFDARTAQALRQFTQASGFARLAVATPEIQAALFNRSDAFLPHTMEYGNELDDTSRESVKPLGGEAVLEGLVVERYEPVEALDID